MLRSFSAALAIAGAPPLAVFLSEFSILKAGLTQGQYLVTGLLADFHRHRVLRRHGPREPHGLRRAGEPCAGAQLIRGRRRSQPSRLPFSCRLALILAAVPVLVLGVYVPKPLQDLLTHGGGRVDAMKRP